MNIQELRSRYKDDILRIAAEHHAGNVRVFGSILHGNASDDSDIDLLVTLDEKADLMDLAALFRKLSELTGRKVDVVPDDAHIYYPAILQEARTL